MKKRYCINCNKYRKFKNPKLPYIFNETLILSFILVKCGSNNELVSPSRHTTSFQRRYGVVLTLKRRRVSTGLKKRNLLRY